VAVSRKIGAALPREFPLTRADYRRMRLSGAASRLRGWRTRSSNNGHATLQKEPYSPVNLDPPPSFLENRSSFFTLIDPRPP